jgi:hypothetical protein
MPALLTSLLLVATLGGSHAQPAIDTAQVQEMEDGSAWSGTSRWSIPRGTGSRSGRGEGYASMHGTPS